MHGVPQVLTKRVDLTEIGDVSNGNEKGHASRGHNNSVNGKL